MYFIIIAGCNKIVPFIMSGHVSLERAKKYVATMFSSFEDVTEDERKECRNEELEDGSYIPYNFKGETEGLFNVRCHNEVDVYIFRRNDGECSECLKEAEKMVL